MSKDVRPFEEYKEMIKDMRKEEMIKGLYDLSKNITEKDKEIGRLHFIIKEVRELLESKKHCERLFGGVEGKTFIEQALEILDKGSDKE